MLKHKKKLLIASLIFACLSLSLGWYYRDYFTDRFTPERRINFTVYAPRSNETYSWHIAINNYLQGSLSTGVDRHAEVGFMLQGDGSKITQKKTDQSYPRCGEFAAECVIRRTVRGQPYAYTVNVSHEGLRGEWAHLQKSGTDILIERRRSDRPWIDQDWNALIDSFERQDVSKETFVKVSNNHFWIPF